jgi:hypothetical protein
MKEVPMTQSPNMMRGVIHGKMIEVEGDLNLPEGQQVTIIVQPLLSPEEAIRQSFGGWSEDAEELDKFLEDVWRGRQQERPEPFFPERFRHTPKDSMRNR